MRRLLGGCSALAIVAVLPGLFASPSLETQALVLLSESPRAAVDSETAEQRRARLRTIARAIGLAAQSSQEVAALVAIGRLESAWAEYVGRDCLEMPKGASGDCDRGLSRSYWQVRAWCKPAWAFPRGDQLALPAHATCAIRHYRYSLRRCKGLHPSGYVSGGFSGYRSTGCDWPPAVARTAVYSAAMKRLALLD